MKKLTKEIFIERSKEIHGDKYDYSKIEYVNTRTKVCIICPEHGEFWQNPKSHMLGYGCQKCLWEVFDTKTFIDKARKVHGDKYDYSKVEYKDSHTKVCIICPEHGEFWQEPYNHTNGYNCPICIGKFKHDNGIFIDKARKVHGDKYDYSKVEYKDSHTKVCIICPEHGEFWQNPCDHLQGYGCSKCGMKKLWDKRGRMTTKDFIARSNLVHNNKYDYSKVECINTRTKVCIICLKHGEFWQSPKSHLNGCGCPKCRNSYLERKMETFLNEAKIIFEKEKSFPWLKNKENNNLFLDFYLPQYNVAIECQGVQHFIPIKNNVEKFNKIQYNDIEKKTKCIENHIHIIYFSNEVICKNYTNENIFYKKEDVLNEISRIRI